MKLRNQKTKQNKIKKIKKNRERERGGKEEKTWLGETTAMGIWISLSNVLSFVENDNTLINIDFHCISNYGIDYVVIRAENQFCLLRHRACCEVRTTYIQRGCFETWLNARKKLETAT